MTGPQISDAWTHRGRVGSERCHEIGCHESAVGALIAAVAGLRLPMISYLCGTHLAAVESSAPPMLADQRQRAAGDARS